MAKFNNYIEHPEIERWRELCVNEGELYRHIKGEEFVSIGRVEKVYRLCQVMNAKVGFDQQFKDIWGGNRIFSLIFYEG